MHNIILTNNMIIYKSICIINDSTSKYIRTNGGIIKQYKKTLLLKYVYILQIRTF